MARDDRFISEGHAGESYVEVLNRLSAATGVRRYIEVGVSHGGVFGRIACRHGIGVDPLFQIDRNIMAHKSRVSLFQLTGDAFFRRMRPRRLLGGPADLVFLDGLHLFEALLRDFLNAEAVCAPDSIIALHDCLPLNAVMIGRDSDEANRLIRFPIDPFGMAEIGFAQAPRGLADAASGLINRKRYQASSPGASRRARNAAS